MKSLSPSLNIRSFSLKFLTLTVFTVFLLYLPPLFSQDSLNVTFRYSANDNAIRAYLPGSFNNWGNNSNGRIQVNDGSLMQFDQNLGLWTKTIRLRVGGGSFTHQGRTGYAYKFHEQYNASGSQWQWFTDPLNPIVIGANSDSFIEITHPMIFQVEPANNNVARQDATPITASVSARDDDPIDPNASTLSINGQLAGSFGTYYDANLQILHIDAIESLGVSLAPGQNTLEIRAVTASGSNRTLTTSFSYLMSPAVVREPRPQGLEDGVTIHQSINGKVSFSIFAPGKEFVHVIGDHSNWEVRPEYLMKLDEVRPDSAHFWLTIDNLSDGVYRFQYLIDGELRIADLFSEMVLDPDFDRFIGQNIHPDMPEYPVGSTTGMVGVFEVGRTPFVWQSTNYQRPAQHELVIYELLLRDFVNHSTFDTLRDTLDYLQRLGINAIELMPVSNFDGNDSWGYNPNFHGALDKSYGTRESFKRFVDEAHSRGIAVILDVVYNHAQDKSPLIQLYGPHRSGNPFLGPGHAYNVFFHLNHDHPYIQYWVDRMNRYWIETYRIDGYRFDLTKGFASNVNTQSLLDGYNSRRIANLKRMFDRIRDVDATAYVILEHFAANTEERELAEYRMDEGIAGMMLWGNMNHAYNEATMGYSSNFNAGYYLNRGWNVPSLITYMESHDEQWLMFKNLNYGACENAPTGGNTCNTNPGNYNIRDPLIALDRQKLAGAFFFTIPGPKMMWQFGELGYGGGPGECLKPGSSNGDCLPGDPGRTARKPVRWDYRDHPERYMLYRTWGAIIGLRNEHEVFRSPETQVFMNTAGIIKQIRLEHSSMNVVIVGNFGVTNQQGTVNFGNSGTWYDYFSGNSLTISGNSQSMTLLPGQYHIYTSKQLPLPDLGQPTSIDHSTEVPVRYALYQNYPNPFNPTTQIQFELPESAFVTVAVFDILGRQIAELVNEELIAGTYSVPFTADGISSGTYLVRMVANGRAFTRKMTLIK